MFIRQDLAKEIVHTVKSVCGYDVNFVNADGYIYASTNPSRVGYYHEPGHDAGKKNKTIVVAASDKKKNIVWGINQPVYHQGKLAAVIGISGPPEEVRKYGELASRITVLLIREQELSSLAHSQEEMKNFLLTSLLWGHIEDIHYLTSVMGRLHITNQDYRVICLETALQKEPAAKIPQEPEIYGFFQRLGLKLYTHRYPRYLAAIDSKAYTKNKDKLQDFAQKHHGSLHLGIGTSCPLLSLSHSYHTALTALKSLENSPGKYLAVFDELKIELLLANIGEEARQLFLRNVLGNLPPRELQILHAYFSCNQSLKETSRVLHMHKNTLQNHLLKIKETAKLDPRLFSEAAVLYLACQLQMPVNHLA